jgi:hypothetical protein
MSYELHLLRRGQDGPWDHSIEKELNPGPIVDSKEQEKQYLAGALCRFNQALKEARFDYTSLAASQKVDEAEARRRFRHIELNSDDYSGIQITLFDDTVDLIFPYWHSGEQARSVLQQVWDYLAVLQTWGSFVTYDAQLERVLNLDTDFETVLQYVQAGNNSTYASASHV